MMMNDSDAREAPAQTREKSRVSGGAAGLAPPSRPPRGGFVLLNDAYTDAAAAVDRDALIFGPCPDIAAALAACRSAPWPPALSFASRAGMFDERCELAAERGGVFVA